MKMTLRSSVLALAGVATAVCALSAYNNYPGSAQGPSVEKATVLTAEQSAIKKLDATVQALFLDNSLLRQGPKRVDGTRREPMLGMSRVAVISPTHHEEVFRVGRTSTLGPTRPIRLSNEVPVPAAPIEKDEPQTIREFKAEVESLTKQDYDVALFGFASNVSTLKPDTLQLKYSSSTAVSGPMFTRSMEHPPYGIPKTSGHSYSKMYLTKPGMPTGRGDLAGKALLLASDSVKGLLADPSTPIYRNEGKIYMEARAITVSDSSCLKCHSNMSLDEPLAIMIYAVSKKEAK
jgi:hypothetical protein